MSGLSSQAPWPGDCECWASLIRIISQIEAAAPGSQASPSSQEQQAAPSSDSRQPHPPLARHLPLDERLVLGELIVNQWELLNGCAHSASHLGHRGPALLRVVCDAVGRVLTLYELAVVSAEDALAGRASVGTLELDEADDVRAVARAALSWSTVRCGAVLQDIEEESQDYSAEELREANHPVVKDLTGRTLRLLGQVESCGGAIL